MTVASQTTLIGRTGTGGLPVPGGRQSQDVPRTTWRGPAIRPAYGGRMHTQWLVGGATAAHRVLAAQISP